MEHDRIHRRLTAKLAELTERARRIETDLRAPLDDDSAERAIMIEDDEPMEAIERSALVEISHIRDALARLANGSYGICLCCGARIDPARLDAVPAATLCVRCANRA